jgi:tryptophan halogenase
MSETRPAQRVVIVGGGTAGWMTAAALSRYLGGGAAAITLVESPDIGSIGVGEATIPPIRDFNQRLGIDEADFIRATRASIKLAIEFVGWGGAGDRYMHPFGDIGRDFDSIAFHQYWLAHRDQPGIGRFDDYALSAIAARSAKFAPPSADPRSVLSQLAYAYHFDAGLYAQFLRDWAVGHGVVHIEGTVDAVESDGATVAAIRLADGQRIEGDLFIDCTGFRGLLIDGALGVGWQDWSDQLLCDRAFAVPSARTEPVLPFTRSTADSGGWRWRIPLQHRTGNGIVFSSAHMSDDAARAALLAGLDGDALDEPRLIRFRPGVRDRLWAGNVVAMGLAGGFVEPLESTSIHVIQAGIARLLWLFPAGAPTNAERDAYNASMRDLYDYIRDFILLHYRLTSRTEPFWQAARNAPLPDSLLSRMDQFMDKGRIAPATQDLFAPVSWAAVMLGQGMVPTGHDPLIAGTDRARAIQAMRQLADTYQRAAAAMPDHTAALDALMQRRAAAA